MKKWLIGIAFLFTFFCLFYSKANVIDTVCIALDAGHGGVDGGASVGDVKESDITLAIVLKAKEIFEKNGINVILTRETKDDLCDDEFVKREDMSKRVKKVHDSNAQLLLSVHLNKFSVERYRGAQVFYSKTNESNRYLADRIQDNLIRFLNNTDRKIVQRDNIFLLNKVTIPSCIVECGFMSNQEELKLLQTEEYQYKIAYALLYGVEDYLKLN